jgi:RNA polymerase sigma-70 factor, ECF subfamily
MLTQTKQLQGYYMQENIHDIEADIINRIKKGEINAFEFLVKKYEKPLFIMINNMIREQFNTEDLLQEVFLAAYINIQSFNPGLGRFSTWLFRIARNKCLNEIKKNQFRAVQDIPEIVGRDNPAEDILVKEAFTELDNALDRLSKNDRMIFILAEFENMSYKEIAEIEGIKEGTVKSRLSRTKEKLQKILNEYMG